MGRNGSNCFVRLGLRSRGFKALILHLISVLGASWDFLDQRFAAIDGYRRRGTEFEGYRYVGKVLKRCCVPWFSHGLLWSKKEGFGALATMKRPRYLGEVLVSSLGWKELSHQGG
ncbi:hypothetical protein Tco_0712038 [Tanacetum coccineum]